MARQSPTSARSARSGSSPAARRRTPPPRKRDTPWGVIAASLVVVLFVGGILAYAVLNTGSQSTTGQAAGARAQLDKQVQVFDESKSVNNHVTGPITYPQTPPAGGPHDPVWQNCGVYDQPVRSENAVHSQEHGAVWVTYPPSLPPAQVAALRKTVTAAGTDYVLLSPFPGLPDNKIFLSSWGRQLSVQSPSDPRIDTFIQAYANNQQTTPEFGARCSGGVGTPIS